MRTIALPTDPEAAQKSFGLMYTACFAGDGAKTAAEGRRLAKVQDALDAISHDEALPPAQAAATGEKTRRQLNDGVTAFDLEDADWEVLKGRFFGASIPWTAGINRDILKAHDMVADAQEKK